MNVLDQIAADIMGAVEGIGAVYRRIEREVPVKCNRCERSRPDKYMIVVQQTTAIQVPVCQDCFCDLYGHKELILGLMKGAAELDPEHAHIPHTCEDRHPSAPQEPK
jgi:hypothetical protein